jgi:1-acyl-sn-glycerol-3-phosphate acyltransferase
MFARQVTRRLFRWYARRVDVSVTGEPIDGSRPAVFVANHLSNLDPFILAYVVLPGFAYFLAKPGLFRLPLGWWMSALGAWNVARPGTPARAVKALRAGHSVALFPEGTRGTGPLQPLDDGAAAIAYLADAPIVPIGIAGTELALPRGAVRPKSAVVSVRIGAPFRLPRVRTRGPERWKPASGLIMSRIAALLPASYQPG